MGENGLLSAGKTETPIGSKDVNVTTVSTEEDATGTPSLEISTSRVLFFARPGELAHGVVQIKNNGTTTVYYSWAPFQPVTALDGEGDTDTVNTEEEKNTKKQGSDDTVEETTDEAAVLHTSSDQQSPAGSRQTVKKTPHQMNVPLRSLAKKLAQSKSFFFLSAQLDGVILPDDEETFSFSVRAAFPGRFLQYYELLMIPAAASRVVVELCAIIQEGGHSLEAVFRPVAAALDAKAVVDAQRELINSLAANTNVYEAAEIARATQACLDAAKVSQEARGVLVAKWRKAWNSTTHLALRLPFNIDVYERLNALHQNLVQTMLALGQPLHHEEWDGSVQTLQSDLCKLRDAVSRNVLREGLNVLLRAATVCELDDEPLDLLLQRVAGMVAFSALAQQTGELDDAVLLTIGLREPRGARNGAHSQAGARGTNNAGGGGAAGGARRGVGGRRQHVDRLGGTWGRTTAARGTER
ncbi:hypothetical protein TRSC58_03409 [Trypanosoma rangeli SC58]|uniref:Uncharacterized protein n=1 Tax=Trypanosoma rangeli SC58 TaxID=429131 RepID=A0A061J3G6_TRYRA|nr:hypothetical protein TRSC58_03409 [Trypanosoma rangeli SC58]